MRLSLFVSTAALVLAAAPALAQTPPATIGDRYVPAPWWMRDPVIASIGHVRAEVPANRASFQASFRTVERTAQAAQTRAADQIRALSQALAAYGVDKVRVETSLTTQPLYDQYRDENGVVRENTRADQVERYAATSTISVTVRDTAVLERAYATVLAAQPTSTTPVYFNLEPSNTLNTAMAGEAVKDAQRRATAAAENAGARLGPVRVIDPSGRACQTDVLAGWPSYSSGAPSATTVEGMSNAEQITVTGSRMERAPPPPPPAPMAPPPPPGPGEAAIESARLALQPPLREVSSSACVVYGLQ
ncbi:MAG TPA: SIMPL domain-containing protein [Caulobacteraceae bacterium]